MRAAVTVGCVLAVIVATACASPRAGPIELEVWAANDVDAVLTELARQFDAEVDGRSVQVEVTEAYSADAAETLGGIDPDGAVPEEGAPDAWVPAWSAWGELTEGRLAAAGRRALLGEPDPLMSSPMILAVPEPMARAMGWPERGDDLSIVDFVDFAALPGGWAELGHPEWGPFVLCTSVPALNSEGLATLVALAYGYAGSPASLGLAESESVAVKASLRAARAILKEQPANAIRVLGDLYDHDARGQPLAMLSALPLEEKLRHGYNAGTVVGTLPFGGKPRPPSVPLQHFRPDDGTVVLDHPMYVLDAAWVDPAEAEAARMFGDFVTSEHGRRMADAFGFGDDDTAALPTPDGATLLSLLDTWQSATP